MRINRDLIPSIVESKNLRANEVNESLKKSDDIEKLKIFRIHRDLRFSKDKTPYKKNIGMDFHRAKPDK